MDRDAGTYELIGEQLIPAARLVIDSATPRRDEYVLDVGCGTGNATLLAAERGAVVTGLDPSPRLLAVAATEATSRQLPVTFLRGEAAAIPLPDAAADAPVSVFGVVFAPDAPAIARPSWPVSLLRADGSC